MAKKKESVGVIKPKRVVKKSTEVDRLNVMQEQIFNLNAAVNHQGARIVDLQNLAGEQLTKIKTGAACVSSLEDNRSVLKSSFFARIKWLFTGKVDTPKWR